MTRILVWMLALLLGGCGSRPSPVLTPLYPFEPASTTSAARYLCGRPAVMGVRVERGSLPHQRWEVSWKVTGPRGEVKTIPTGVNTCLSNWDTTTDEPTFCYVMDLHELFTDCSAGLEGKLQPAVCLTSFDSQQETTCYDTEVRFTREPGVEESGCKRDLAAVLSTQPPGTVDDLLREGDNVVQCLEKRGLVEEAYMEQRNLCNLLFSAKVSAPVWLPTIERMGQLLNAVKADLPYERLRIHLIEATAHMEADNYAEVFSSLDAGRRYLARIPSAEASQLLEERFASAMGDLGLLVSQASHSRLCLQAYEQTQRPDFGYSCTRLLAEAHRDLGLDVVSWREAISAFRHTNGITGPGRFEAMYGLRNLGRLLVFAHDMTHSEWRVVTDQMQLIPPAELNQLPHLTAWLAGLPGLERDTEVDARTRLADALFQDAKRLWHTAGRDCDASAQGLSLAWSSLERGDMDEADELARQTAQHLAPCTTEEDRKDLRHLQVVLATTLARSSELESLLPPFIRDIEQEGIRPYPAAEGWIRVGVAYQSLGREVEAEEAMRRAMRLIQSEARLLPIWYVPGYLRAARQYTDPILSYFATSGSESSYLDVFHAVTAPTQTGHLSLDAESNPAAMQKYLACASTLKDHREGYGEVSVAGREAWIQKERHLTARCEEALGGLIDGSEVAPPLDLARLQSDLAEDTEVWVLTSLPDRVHGVRITRQGVNGWDSHVPRQGVLKAIDQVQVAIQEGIDQNRPIRWADGAMSELSRLLPPGGPAHPHVIALLDPLLRSLPLASLDNGGVPLWRQVSSLSYASDLAQLGRDLRRPSHPAWQRPLAVVDAEVKDHHLPGAASDGYLIRRLDNKAIVLRGHEASVSGVRAAVSGCSPVVFSVHGSSQEGDPVTAALRLSQGEQLTVVDLARLPLEGSLTVLGSCEGGAGGIGGATLAQAARMAGASWVVASRFEVDDLCMASFGRAFYPLLQREVPPATALNSALGKLDDAKCQQQLVMSLWITGEVSTTAGQSRGQMPMRP